VAAKPPIKATKPSRRGINLVKNGGIKSVFIYKWLIMHRPY
jgi:hypothetical protein